MVGKKFKNKGETESNWDKKIRAFKELTSKAFLLDDCLAWGTELITGPINKYRIDVNEHTINLYQKANDSNVYQFEVIVDGETKFKKHASVNKRNYLPFFTSGPNWGRYGERDKKLNTQGKDNYGTPEMAARLLGFFYSLPLEGINEMYYYNDISAHNNVNLGHHTHNTGEDVDIRYPGSGNADGEVLWSQAMNKAFGGSETAFVAYMKRIFAVAGKWGFTYNFAYKGGIGNSSYAEDHVNHFHIGLKR